MEILKLMYANPISTFFFLIAIAIIISSFFPKHNIEIKYGGWKKYNKQSPPHGALIVQRNEHSDPPYHTVVVWDSKNDQYLHKYPDELSWKLIDKI